MLSVRDLLPVSDKLGNFAADSNRCYYAGYYLRYGISLSWRVGCVQ